MDSNGNFYMIWRRPRSGKKQHGIPTKKHRSLKSASDEAERLAKECGGHYAIMECIAVCQGEKGSDEVKWVTPDEHTEPEVLEGI